LGFAPDVQLSGPGLRWNTRAMASANPNPSRSSPKYPNVSNLL